MRILLLLSLLAFVSLSYEQSTTTTTAASTTTTSATRVPCTNPCTHRYRPVCGMYNGRQRTFENRCILRANRRCAHKRGTLARPRIRFLHVGRCTQKTIVRAATGNRGKRVVVVRRRQING